MTNSDHFSSGANFCSLSHVLWSAIQTGSWQTPLTQNQSAVSAEAEVAGAISDWVMLWINIWPVLKCQGGSQLWARPVSRVCLAGRLISCIFMAGPGFNFLSLTKPDCLWQEQSAHLAHFGLCRLWRAGNAARELAVLVCVSKKDLTSELAGHWGKGLESQFLMLDQRTYWAFKVSFHLRPHYFTYWLEFSLLGTQEISESSLHINTVTKSQNFLLIFHHFFPTNTSEMISKSFVTLSSWILLP